MIKKLAKMLLSSPLLTTSKTRVIFMHHDVSSSDAPHHSPTYSTDPARFKEQIEFISQHFDLVDVEELFDSSPSRKPRASLTFDDGFYSVRDAIRSYLAPAKIPSSIFVNSQAVRENRLSYTENLKTIDRTQKIYLDENDLRELDSAGVRIGSHGMTHRVLSKCDPVSLEQEIGGNQRFLSSILGKPLRHIAIPYGKAHHYDEEVIEACRLAGHDFIYSNNPAPFRAGSIDYKSQVIPRICLTDASPAFIRFLINRAVFKKIEL